MVSPDLTRFSTTAALPQTTGPIRPGWGEWVTVLLVGLDGGIPLLGDQN
jgi:hypothetical protein